MFLKKVFKSFTSWVKDRQPGDHLRSSVNIERHRNPPRQGGGGGFGGGTGYGL